MIYGEEEGEVFFAENKIGEMEKKKKKLFW